MNGKNLIGKMGGLVFAAGLFVVLGAQPAVANLYIEADEGVGQYDYIEKDATTYVHL